MLLKLQALFNKTSVSLKGETLQKILLTVPIHFFSIMYITKLSMTSTTCSTDVDPIKTTDLRVPKINVDSWHSSAYLDLSARRSVKFLTKCMLLKSQEPVHAMR